MRRGVHVAAPLVPAAIAPGVSFGVLARASHWSAAGAVATALVRLLV